MRFRSAFPAALAAMLVLADFGVAAARDYAVSWQQVNRQDRQFVKEAALDGRFEIALGKLARQNAQADEVKRYGRWMVRDNSAIGRQLATLAHRKDLSLPQALDAQDRRQLDRLAGLHGTAFDRAYLAAMVKDHDSEIRMFRQEVDTGGDTDVKRFAQSTLAGLARYDQLAKQVDRSLTAAGSSQRPVR